MNNKLYKPTLCIIYVIRNIINNNKYIGSTIKGRAARKNSHFSSLKRNKHHSCKLQNDYNKFGKDKFVFEIIEEEVVSEMKRVVCLEQKWIDEIKPEYNISAKAYSNYGVKLSQSAKDKISKAQKGRRKSEETKQKLREINLGKKKPENIKKILFDKMKDRCIKVYQYDKKGEYIKTFDSLSQAKKEGFHPHKIKQSCLGIIENYKGFIWKSPDLENGISKIIIDTTNKKCKKVSQYTKDGKHIKDWDSIVQASTEGNYDFKKISKCCKREYGRNTHSGYIWVYTKEKKSDEISEVNIIVKLINTKKKTKRVAQIDKNGMIIKIWDCADELSKYGFYPSAIRNICNGKNGNNTSGGFIWRYYDKIKDLSIAELKENISIRRKKYVKPKKWVGVLQLDIDGNLIKSWESITHAGKNGYRVPQIVECCKGRRNSHAGFKWTYANKSAA